MARKYYKKFLDRDWDGVDEKKQKLAQNLMKIMEAREMKVQDLANQIGIPKSSVSNYRTGKDYPSPEKLQRIANALSVNVEDLTGEQPVQRVFDVEPNLGEPNYLELESHTGLSALAISKLVKLSTKDGGQCSELLDRMLCSGCFEQLMISLSKANKGISRNINEVYNSLENLKGAKPETIERFFDTYMHSAQTHIYIAMKEIDQYMQDVLRYNELEEYKKEALNGKKG